MRRPIVVIVAILLCCGCRTPEPGSAPVDPFFGRTRIEPPRTGSIGAPLEVTRDDDTSALVSAAVDRERHAGAQRPLVAPFFLGLVLLTDVVPASLAGVAFLLGCDLLVGGIVVVRTAGR